MDPFKNAVIGSPPSRTYTASDVGLLTSANNLSDVADGATALTNIGGVATGSAAQLESIELDSTGVFLGDLQLDSTSTDGGPQPVIDLRVSHNAAKANDGNSKIYGYLTTLSVNDGSSAPQGYYGNVNHIDVRSDESAANAAYSVYASTQTKSGGAVAPAIATGDAFYGEVRAGAGTITAGNGLDLLMTAAASSTMTTANGVKVTVQNSGTMTTARGFYVPAFTGTITNRFGVYSEEAGYFSSVSGTSAVALQANTAGTGSGLRVSDAGATMFDVADGGAITTYFGGLSMTIGGDISALGRTNATRKNARLAVHHYTNSEEPAAAFFMDCNTSVNDLYLGGGSGTMNATTSINFYTAANNTTTSGTLRGTINAAGSWVLGSAAIATNATDGFLYIPACAGTPTGTPTSATGRVPLVVDSTNNKLYFYSGGAWRNAGP